MSILSIYRLEGVTHPETISDFAAIQSRLAQQGVQLERWEASQPLSPEAGQEEVLAAYRESIDRLNDRFGFQSMDVVSVRPDHPDKAALREKFLDEHTHADFEVRFFVEGKGLFYLHLGEQVYLVLCQQGDLISVPANTPHWFDMGENPNFRCIRFFTRPNGWVGNFTGSDIAKSFPDFDQYLSSLA